MAFRKTAHLSWQRIVKSGLSVTLLAHINYLHAAGVGSPPSAGKQIHAFLANIPDWDTAMGMMRPFMTAEEQKKLLQVLSKNGIKPSDNFIMKSSADQIYISKTLPAVVIADNGSVIMQGQVIKYDLNRSYSENVETIVQRFQNSDARNGLSVLPQAYAEEGQSDFSKRKDLSDQIYMASMVFGMAAFGLLFGLELVGAGLASFAAMIVSFVAAMIMDPRPASDFLDAFGAEAPVGRCEGGRASLTSGKRTMRIGSDGTTDPAFEARDERVKKVMKSYAKKMAARCEQAGDSSLTEENAKVAKVWPAVASAIKASKGGAGRTGVKPSAIK